MTLIDRILANRRLVLTTVALLSLTGVIMWMTMVRQEDPRMPDYWGQVVAPYPGADALTVERLVLEPIEDALAEVSEIKLVDATAYDEVAVLLIELRGDIDDYSEAWDQVRDALVRARHDFPEGAGMPVLDENQMDQDAIVLAVTGSLDPLVLLRGARKLKDRLNAMALVKRAHIIADPGEQVTIALNDAAARRLGLNARQLAAGLSARNRILSGGSLQLSDKSLRLRPLSEFASVEEIAGSPIPLPEGGSVPLEEVARVHWGPAEPASAKMHLNGVMAVGVAVVPRESINLVDFGHAVTEQVAALAPALQPLRVQTVTFQPARTQTRLSELNGSLLFGVLIVAGVLVIAMGLRLGLVVTAVVPLVTMTSVAVFAWGGGVLHQISISALVLALGMLVDNAIVMAENVQWRLDRGESPQGAARGAIRELATPLAAATLTTMAAFVPMLISSGPTADFTRSIPIIIMLTLTISYAYALFATPILSQMVLRAGAAHDARHLERVGQRAGRLAVFKPWWVLGATGGLMLISLLLSSQVSRQFFPSADRNQVLVDVKLAEGSHINTTVETVRTAEKALLARPDVTRVSSFIGRSAPAFYYNVPRIPFSPHFAQLIVQTRAVADNPSLVAYIRKSLRPALPRAELVIRKLEQGPPVQAPVEVRLSGFNLDHLNQATTAVSGILKSIDGTLDVRHDLGPGAPTLRFRIDDAVAARYGISRVDVAQAIYGRTRGMPVGELYVGEDPVPVVIRSALGERLAVSDLEAVDVPALDGRVVPLAQLAHIEPVWQPAAIKHRNGSRLVTVSSQLQEGYVFTQVLSALTPKLDALDLPPDVTVSYGGDAEGSGEANSEMMRKLPIGLLLLLAVLLAEFNSFRRMVIILMTVPLAAAGVIPGLLISGQPFGFMSLLGVIALVGIVVNNAIVMLEVVEQKRKEGTDISSALQEAVARRIRPILLTTATTVAGLLPLAVSSSTLWPPLASAMISGLLASTLLTLMVVPALYRVLMSPLKTVMPGWMAAAASAIAMPAALFRRKNRM
jgi:multidrug efflux pump subunit AcrB